MRVLITSGATREPIDRVRFISNLSTGATGAALAERYSSRGHRVFYLHGLGAARPDATVRARAFTSFTDLDRKLKALLRRRRFDVVLHLAAVSDYSVRSVVVDGRRRRPARLRKLDSAGTLRLELARNFKILSRLPGYAAGRPLIVGFKLTDAADEAAVHRAVARLGCDLVVHNDLRDMKDDRARSFRIWESGRLLAACASRTQLARRLCAITEERRQHAARHGRR